MAALPASPVPTISPAEMQILISRSGLVLNPGQIADLVLAWRQVAGLIAGIPQGRKLADDLAYGFRLAPPGGHAAAPRPAARAVEKRQSSPKPKAAAKAKSRAKPAATAKPQSRTRPKAAAKPQSRARPKAQPKPKASAPRRAPRGR